jgi:hypothetical protein
MKTFISTAIAILLSVSLMAQTSANLKLNLINGKTYKAKVSTEQNTTSNFNGMQQNTTITSVMFMSLKPTAINADNILAEVRFDTISTKISMPNMEMSSVKPGDLKSTDPGTVMCCILNRLSQAIFQVKMGLTGNVIEISNISPLAESILKGIDSIQGQAAGMLKTQTSMLVSEKSIKSMIESVTAYLPGKQVKVGDKWDTQLSLVSGGMGMLIANNYKLKKISGNQAELAAESTIEPASQYPIDMNGAKISYDVRGLGKSTVDVDTQTGWLIKASSKQHLMGNMNLKMQGNDMQIPVEIDDKTETVSVP